jgi:hypothetical protein
MKRLMHLDPKRARQILRKGELGERVILKNLTTGIMLDETFLMEHASVPC